jgi:hypothetical protein
VERANVVGRDEFGTIACVFRDRLGLVVDPATDRVEVLEVDNTFDGTDGVVATGRGRLVAALTPRGLTAGRQCRASELRTRRKLRGDMIGPWPETMKTYVACWIASTVFIDARTSGRAKPLVTLGTRSTTYIRLARRADRKGGLSFSFNHCHRFDVTGRTPP